MIQSKHQIARLTVEIETESMDDAFERQNETANAQNAIINSIEKAFDRVGGVDEMIQMDRLEIDLSDQGFESIDQKFLEAIERKVFEQISAMKQDVSLSYGDAMEEKVFEQVSVVEEDMSQGHGDKIGYHIKSQINSSFKRLEKHQSNLDLVFFILENGHLPWWAQQETKISLEALVLDLPEPSLKLLYQHFGQHKQKAQVSRRLFRHLRPASLKIILEKSQMKSIFSDELVTALVNLPHKVRETVLIHVLLENIENNKPVSLETKVVELRQIIHEAVPQNIETRTCLVILDQFIRESGISIPVGKETSESKKNVGRPTREERSESVKTSETNEPEVSEIAEKIYTQDFPEMGIIAKNAGLVLVQPFLNAFFTELGLVIDKEFVSKAAQHKACYVLYFLATGEADAPEEHDLIVEKLLCGIQIQEVLLPFNPLTEELIESTKELLTAVLDNWTALGSSSIHAIRQTFLQREGQILEVDGGMKIRFEREALDILLDRLPWGISMYKLPWSDNMIYVEW